MDKFIEDKEILKIGRFKIDASNVPMYRKKISRRAWDEAVKKMNNGEEFNAEMFDEIQEKYGLYMLRQDFSVLKRRMSFVKALWSYTKRYLVSIKYIKKLNEKEYDNFIEWAYFNITGTKKKDLETVDQIQKIEKQMLEEMKKLNLDPDTLVELLLTFLRETAGRMNISVPSQKA